jgi:hypothetical protein
MNRRMFLACAAAPVFAASDSRSLLFATEEQAGRMRDLAHGDRRARFEKFAADALRAGPWSVTYHRPVGLGVDAGPNDYYSEGPYWWPDPKNPKGPYIRKDGERNPERFMGNRSDLGRVCDAAISLGMGAYLLRDKRCTEHAAKVLSVWFLDPKTRMNPNLEYGQAVRGHNTGRGTGIIDTVSFIHLVQGVFLLEAAGDLPGDVSKGMREWFGDYLKWMTTSQKGLDEKKSGNNHATWWTAQAASYATFTGDAATRKMCWERYRSYLVPTEIQADGSCPREEARTQSLSYSSMNLDAFASICRLAQLDSVDLWHFRAPSGGSVEQAFRYLVPFMRDPATWKKEQITKYDSKGYFFPGLAGIGMQSKELIDTYRSLPHGESPWLQLVDLLVAVTV